MKSRKAKVNNQAEWNKINRDNNLIVERSRRLICCGMTKALYDDFRLLSCEL